jgi:hypothetical protein
MDIIELMHDEWIIDENPKTVTMWYSAKRGNYNRKAFVFPRDIVIDATFAEAIGMILGDGDMHRIEKCHFTYTSKDVDISMFVLNFLRDKLLVDDKDITFVLRYRYIDPKIDELAAKLSVDKNRIKRYFSPRTNYPALHIQVNGAVFRGVFEKIVGSFVHSDFVSDVDLRRGFLRGIFAAEGCVGVNYKEHYICSITFTLSKKEQSIADLIQKCLLIEGISFTQSYRKSTIETVISNWKNYLKCWNIKLFDSCSRKKEKFLSVVRDSKICAIVDSSDLKRLSEKYMQKEIAEIIDSWQGNVCRVLQGKFLLTLKQIKILEEKGFRFSIKSIRIGNLTELPWNEETRELFSTTL